MAIIITKQDGIYEIEGKLTPSNITSLKSYFELLIKQSHFIKISLNKVIEMDSSGVAFISSLYHKAVSTNKVFFIMNLYNKELEQLFKKERIFTY